MSQRTCSIEGCERGDHLRQGLCNKHYRQLLKDGAIGRVRGQRTPIAERFWTKVNRDGPVPPHMPHLGPCWEWTGTRTKGYGHMKLAGRGRLVLTHRVAWELLVGPIPDDKPCVLHHCDNRACVRADPDPLVSHLFVGTYQDNSDDKFAKGRGQYRNRTECKYGHPLNDDNLVVDRKGHRRCRTCANERQRRRKARRRVAG